MEHENTMGLPAPPSARRRDAHKGEAGRVLVLAGSREMPGAALLCAAGALRGGAGLVTLACLDEALMLAAPLARPELILWELGPGCDDEALTEGLATRDFDVVVAGPGLGRSKRAAALLEELLRAWEGPLVFDADALNLVAERPALRRALRERGTPAVITPHPGEAGRLLGRSLGRSSLERSEAAVELTASLGTVTCLKGAGTVVVDSSGNQLWINPSGNPGMATAGSGDVLAGLLAALLYGAEDTEAVWRTACTAVYWHGLAGDRAARRLGQRAMLASDLADELGLAELEGPWG